MQSSTIYEPVQEDLEKVESWLKSVNRVDFAPLSELLDYSLSGGGKRIRPALGLLSGKFHDYDLDCLLPMADSCSPRRHAALQTHPVRLQLATA